MDMGAELAPYPTLDRQILLATDGYLSPVGSMAAAQILHQEPPRRRLLPTPKGMFTQ